MNQSGQSTVSRFASMRVVGPTLLLALVGCSSTRAIDDVLAAPADTHHHLAQATEAAIEEGGDAASSRSSRARAPIASAEATPSVVAPLDAPALRPEIAAGSPVAAPAQPAPATDALAAPEDLPSRAELMRMADLRLAESTAVCRALLERARADDADYDTLMAASRALIFNADLRIQAALAFQFDPSGLPAPAELIDAEDEVGSALKSEVRSLASSSRELADRALELRPEDPAARLFSTLGTGLKLWAMPTFQALANGAATALPRRIKELAEAHPEFEGASPLRLKGRFASRAPWPYKDREVGRDSLAIAAELAPIPLNLLFYGDALWLCGQEDEALETWRLATRATADEETKMAAPMLRELARLRIESARQNR